MADISLDMAIHAESAGSTLLTKSLLTASLDAIIAAIPEDCPRDIASHWKRVFRPKLEHL